MRPSKVKMRRTNRCTLGFGSTFSNHLPFSTTSATRNPSGDQQAWPLTYTLLRKNMMSPSLTMYSLPSNRCMLRALASLTVPAVTISS